KQGIMGYFWALISLDSNSFIIPDNLPITREEIIQSIIQSQLDDGGFSLSGTSGDSDVTAIALTALSPYKDDDNIKVSINKGIEFLSQVQLSNGGYQSYGAPNSESSSQVIIALCSLGINPMTDERFIKNGASVLDSLEKYRAENGEYYHMLGDNQKTNRLATQQGLLAMVAMSKYLSGSQGIYSFKPEPIDNNDDNNNDIDNDVKFTDYDRNRVEQLLEDVQASDLNEINRLIQKLEETKSSFNTNTNTNTNTSDNISNHTSTSDYNDLYSKLYNAKEKSEKILIKINNTISDIWELNKVFNLSDKKKISEIKKACEGLSEDDLKLVENYDVLEKLEAEYNSKVRSLVVTIMIIIFVIGAILVLIIRRIKRHRLKNN
ncbi:MAG: terpene cyclase/mutase family protein, partial [Clostridiales bacterium]|nr:terpene cyclase/mutase family protein [Clostridiales bacterium]